MDDISPYNPRPFRFSALYNRYSAAYQARQAGRGVCAWHASLPGQAFSRRVESTDRDSSHQTFF